MDMAPVEGVIKIKDPPKGPASQDLCSLLSPMAMAMSSMVLVEVGEATTDGEDRIIIMVLLHSLMDHQCIEVLLPQDQVHLDIVLLRHHQDLMDSVNIIGIMHHHLLLLDVGISRAHLHHLDVDVKVDLLHLDMDQDIMDPHLHMVETTEDEDRGPKVLPEEIIEALLSLDISVVLVHLLRASVRSIIPQVAGMDRSLLGPKDITMSEVPGDMDNMIIDLMGSAMVMVTGMEGDIPSSLRRLSPESRSVGRR